MLELYSVHWLVFKSDLKIFNWIPSSIHWTVLFFQELTMITFPEKQVCYLAQLSGNLPDPLQLFLAIKKVKLNFKKKGWKVFTDCK